MPPAPRDLRILTAISFHYVEARLDYLRRVATEQPSLGERVSVRVFTNVSDQAALRSIAEVFPPQTATHDVRVVTVPPQTHPYFLTWAHKQSLRGEFTEDASYTHFVYIENDMLVRREAIAYWLRAREVLRPYRLLPGFLRIERSDRSGEWVSTDLRRPIRLWRRRSLRLDRRRWYLDAANPYQAMYVLDRELAAEHLAGPAMNPDFGTWNIRERAAQGQTFVDIPRGFKARTVLPFDPVAQQIPAECHIHHQPNNYANNPASHYGKVPLSHLVAAPALVRIYAIVAAAVSGTLPRHTQRASVPLD